MIKDNDDLQIKSNVMFDVLKRYDHYIATTNYKVGLMMSFLATVILGLTVRIMFLASSPTPSGTESSPGCLYYIAVTLSLATIISSLFVAIQLLKAVFPNTSNETKTQSLIYFEDVSHFKGGASGYYEKVKSIEFEQIVKDIATQTYLVAGIVNEKFRLLKIAVNTTKLFVIPLLTIALILLILEGLK